jgi:hypothetical protein
MVMGLRAILNAEKDPATQNLRLFEKELMSLCAYTLGIKPRSKVKYRKPL